MRNGQIDDVEHPRLHLPGGQHLRHVLHRPADRHRLADAVGPFVDDRRVVHHLGKRGVHHMLHHHRKGFVDENLVLDHPRRHRLPMPGIFDRRPVEEADRIVLQPRVHRFGDDRVADRFAEADRAVLAAPELCQRYAFRARKLLLRHIPGKFAAVAVAGDERDLLLAPPVSGGDRLHVLHQLARGDEDVGLALDVLAVRVPEENVRVVQQHGAEIARKALAGLDRRVPEGVGHGVAGDGRVVQRASEQVVHVQLFPAVQRNVVELLHRARRLLGGDLHLVAVGRVEGVAHRHRARKEVGNVVVDDAPE